MGGTFVERVGDVDLTGLDAAKLTWLRDWLVHNRISLSHAMHELQRHRRSFELQSSDRPAKRHPVRLEVVT